MLAQPSGWGAAVRRALVCAVLVLLSCTDPHDDASVEVSETEQAELRAIKRDLVYVLAGDGVTMGGFCRRRAGQQCASEACELHEQDFQSTCCDCAGTSYFEAQMRGLRTALEELPTNGSVEVSVIVDTVGAYTFDGTMGVTAGPRVLIDNVRWTVPSRATTLATLRAFSVADLSVDSGELRCGAGQTCVAHGWFPAAMVEVQSHLNRGSVNGELCIVGTGILEGYAAPLSEYPIQIPSTGKTYRASPTLRTSLPYPPVLPPTGNVYENLVNNGYLKIIGYVAAPVDNLFANEHGANSGALPQMKVLKVIGVPKSGSIKISLACEGAGSPTFDVAVSSSMRASDVAAAIAKGLKKKYYDPPLCEPVHYPRYIACNDLKAEDSIQHAGAFVSVVEGLKDGGRYLNSCTLSVNTAKSPGLQVLVDEIQKPANFGSLPVATRQAYFRRANALVSAQSGVSWGRLEKANLRVVSAAETLSGSATEVGLERALTRCLRPRPELRAIEVTQAIQDWNNSVPLYSKKSTYAKVFVENDDTTADPLRFKLAIDRQSCVAGQCSWNELTTVPVTQRPKRYIAVGDAERREVRRDESMSYVFELPRLLIEGTIRVRVADAHELELDCKERDAEADCAVELRVRDSAPTDGLNITPIALDVDGPREATQAEVLGHREGLREVPEAHAYAARMLPAVQLGLNAMRYLKIDGEKVHVAGPSDFETRTNSAYAIHQYSVRSLEWIRAYECSQDAAYCRRMGILEGISPGVDWSKGGLAGVGAYIVKSNSVLLKADMAHEMLHVIGRPHVQYCMDSDACSMPFPESHLSVSARAS